MFIAEDEQRLLRQARQSLEACVRRSSAPAPDVNAPLDRRCGAFVSIHRGSELRGCLGRITTDWAVGRVVAHLAEAVSHSDPRFAPVAVDELGGLLIEISVLTPERRASPSEVEIGRHGVIIERGRHHGLLLPQVAVEHQWDSATFLHYACLKAGLPPGAWREDAHLFVFEAQVFAEAPGKAGGMPVPVEEPARQQGRG